MNDDLPNPKITPQTTGSGPQRDGLILDYASSLRRWSGRMFTLENLSSGLKTFMWVAPLTILIWVYAEREQVVQKEVTLPIAVKSTDPKLIVSLRPATRASSR